MPSEDLTADQIEDWYTAFSELGVNVIEQNEETKQEEEQEEKTVGNIAEDEGTRSDDPVRMYLKEMGSVELLSREGEISIAKRIEAGKELMIGGLYECPITMKHFLNWRDNVDNGSMMLRDIIDLETTYARLNGGANEPIVNNLEEIVLKSDKLESKPELVNFTKNENEESLKKDKEVENENKEFDNEEEEEDDEEEEANLSLVAMEAEIKSNILEMIDDISITVKEMTSLNERRINRLSKGDELVDRSEKKLEDHRVLLIKQMDKIYLNQNRQEELIDEIYSVIKS